MTTPSLLPREASPVVVYARDGDRPVEQALLEAFRLADVDVAGSDHALEDQVDPETLTALEETPNASYLVPLPRWGYQAVVTQEWIRVFETQPAEEDAQGV